MKPILMICAVSGILMVLAFSANVASAGSVTIHTTTPTVTVHPAVTPLVTGKHIPTGKITTRKAGGDQVLYDDKTKGGDDKPTESTSFTYGKIEWQYQQQH
jgi:type VI protein secretion system component Hcp